MLALLVCCCFFFKQKTAYEIKECDWSSDVCSSDLVDRHGLGVAAHRERGLEAERTGAAVGLAARRADVGGRRAEGPATGRLRVGGRAARRDDLLDHADRAGAGLQRELAE